MKQEINIKLQMEKLHRNIPKYTREPDKEIYTDTYIDVLVRYVLQMEKIYRNIPKYTWEPEI